MIRKILFIITLTLSSWAYAATFDISISGLSYTPAVTHVQIGDTVNIMASDNHPAVQTSSADWIAGTPTALGSGWGEKTANFSVVISSNDTIFFMCKNHGGSGMKAMIVADPSNFVIPWLPAPMSFANPVTEGKLKFNLSIEKELAIELYTMNGQQVLHSKIYGTDPQLQLRVVPAIYILKIREEDLITTHRLIVE